jgi:hypothetical protein
MCAFARRRSMPGFAGLAALLLVLVFAPGCGHKSDVMVLVPPPEIPPGQRGAIPPAFLSGPAGAVLAGGGVFVGHMTIESQVAPSAGRPRRVVGDLLARDGLFLFAPEVRGRRSRINYIWDAGKQSGFGISEALEGYGPCSTSIHFTNLTELSRDMGRPAQSWHGHSCRLWDQTVAGGDGSSHRFRVWKAIDRNGLPIRIESVEEGGGTPKLVIEFTQIEAQSPAESAFRPPADFTRYDSLDILLSELALRQRNLRRPGPMVPDDPFPENRLDPYRSPSRY